MLFAISSNLLVLPNHSMLPTAGSAEQGTLLRYGGSRRLAHPPTCPLDFALRPESTKARLPWILETELPGNGAFGLHE
jgi:hypothetical protein